MLLIIHGSIVLLFIILGIAFRKEKGAFLIAGYNTSSAHEKSEIDEKALCKCMSKLMFSIAACWCAVGYGSHADMAWLFVLGFTLFIAVIIGFVIYMNTGNRFKKSH